MPADIALTGSLTGLSTVGGALGPASFSYAITAATKTHSHEIPVPVTASSPVVHTVPALGTQRLFYLKTTHDVVVTINSEAAGTIRAGGVLIRCGMPNVTTVTLDGNGATAGTVFLVVIGD
jgi:hypothetical protein